MPNPDEHWMFGHAGCGRKVPMVCRIAYAEHWTNLLIKSDYRQAILEAVKKCQKSKSLYT